MGNGPLALSAAGNSSKEVGAFNRDSTSNQAAFPDLNRSDSNLRLSGGSNLSMPGSNTWEPQLVDGKPNTSPNGSAGSPLVGE
eukprot:CAMPEP_0170483618 /NCGR_PEP_ID=MMETSP0208-20121228/3282_1 /TAXON_ID=197538 /ORGANISM="Strombidium inclinatum, Strain S3" /LENGTH=82 /DNA_ID=CAMNT_0010756737 /DNA_START=1334 /DNA_END=1582 /DNA_ORIENTATION=-